MARTSIWIALVIVALVMLLAVAGLGWRAWLQSRNEAAAAIRSPNGIDEARFIEVGGRLQWITIRGHDRANPVLLMIDGGPGAAASPLIPSPWEKDFVVVEWDQPGAGRTFAKAGGHIEPGLTIGKLADDGAAVADYLRRRLGKTKVGLLATSFGTVIAVDMVKRRPELFYAYVGTGQEVAIAAGEALNYAHVLAKARARKDAKAIAELEKIGPPPYDSDAKFHVQRKWAMTYETGGPSTLTLLSWIGLAPRYGLADVVGWITAFSASQDHFFGKTMAGPGMSVDLASLGPDFAVPMFVFQGTQDDYTPFEHAKAWFDGVTAPEKLFVAAPGAGHYAFVTREADLRHLLVERVRPLGVQAQASASRTE